MPDTPLKSRAADAAAGCYHCGEPVPASASWPVDIDGVIHSMCCPGCAAVAQTIVDLGQASYYRDRSAFAASANKADNADNVDNASLAPPALQLYDNADPRFARDEHTREATFAVEGIRCAACVWLIEHRLARLPGVEAAQLNVATERLYVRWRQDNCTPGDILAALHAIGYAAYPYDAGRHQVQQRQSARTLGRQLFVAGLAMMQVMMYVAPAYMSNGDGTLDPAMASLMQWASLLLTIPAVTYSALPFWRGALASLRARTLGMDVPVALGIAAAFGASVVATVRGTGAVWFDSVTMFIFLLLCSRWYELRARRRAGAALERLHHALPAAATLLAHYPDSRGATLVRAAALQVDDVIMIKPGEAVAADCVVVNGSTSLDLSLLSGESASVPKELGEALPGGAINAGAVVLARVTRRAQDSTMSNLVKLIDRAGQGKPRIALWADRVAAWFVAGLLLFATCAFGFWAWHDGNLLRAWPIAIAVLVVSCPCALSLATPTALAAATDRLLRGGVLVTGAQTLETLHRATHVVFDKTGTLTHGRPVLQATVPLGAMRASFCLQVAAALDAGSAHPLARAIVAAAVEAGGGRREDWHPDAIGEVPGCGIEAVLHNRRYRLRSAAFVAGIAGMALPPPSAGTAGAAAITQSTGLAPAHEVADGATPVYLGAEGQWLACLQLHDGLREDAQATVDYFRRAGKTVVLLSGDHDVLARRVGDQLGIGITVGGYLPEEKLAFVKQLQMKGAVVAMVGDGINDAAVLSAADVSFAMGEGAALAQAHADAVLLCGRLGAVVDSARVAARTMGVIRQNLAWASVYNVVAIPAAALGLLNPWLAGVGMAASSAVVVANALRLRRVGRET
ncbi:heavy metal translocating P-type ATPase [Duganella phyllosphaerae]|uniref:Putative copper-transporting ATPase PacS n=1 Tax=Duganella phyllosphaerae TaxID=762836 RepID=A0A1E7WEM1_9BURK|nr:heavy metal translocating P-type ATPase [Duganella phyllosphaerae]OEZ96694.1 putative copper-transporting ATPase PacS [Duganella phyllosphaerae]